MQGIIIKPIDKLCECGHFRSEHSQYENGSCFKTKRSKLRRKDKNTGKYITVKENWCCACRCFKEMGDIL